MSWNPNQGQNPQQQSQYSSAAPTPFTDPYASQQSGQQQLGYQPPYGASTTSANGPTSMGMDANSAAGLSYIAGWITGLIFFFMEKQNRFVRFHALQSILFSVALTAFYILLNIVSFALAIASLPFVGLLLSGMGFLVALGAFVVWIFLLINAFQGKSFKLPILGDYAERYARAHTA